MKKSSWVWIGVLIVFIAGGLLYRHFAQEVDSRGATRLMRALEENDVPKMRQLLENGTDIHARDKSGKTALFYAAQYATEPIVLHKLVAAGADTLAKDKNGYTPLMTAARYNSSSDVVMALARYGRFLKEQPENKNQALALAAQYNNATIIKTLLIAGANPASSVKNSQHAADLLAANEKLSEQDKSDLRYIMLVLEILEARAKFQQANYPKPVEKQMASAAPATKKQRVEAAQPNKETPPLEIQSSSRTTISSTPPLAAQPLLSPTAQTREENN